MNSTETYEKVFIVLPDDDAHAAGSHISHGRRQCLICDEIFTKLGSYEHSKTICHALASNAN